MNDTDLRRMSQQHIAECYDFYRHNAPFHPGHLVKIYDHDHRLWAIGKVIGVYWSERWYDWIVRCEFMEQIGLSVDDFSAHQLTVHHGFCGRAV